VSQASVPTTVVGVVEVEVCGEGMPHGLAAVVAGLPVVVAQVFEGRGSHEAVTCPVPTLGGAESRPGHRSPALIWIYV